LWTVADEMLFQNQLSWLPVEPLKSTTKERIGTVPFGKTVIMQLLYQVTAT
jgi:hypothetical protein